MLRRRPVHPLLVAVLLAVALTRSTAPAQPAPAGAPSPEPTAPAAAPPAAEPIPVPEIASRAEQTRTALRAIEQAGAPDAQVETIAAELRERRDRLEERIAETKRVIEKGATLAALSELALDWRSTASDLGRRRAVVTRRAQVLETQLDAVVALRERWEQTRRRALEQAAPPAVIQAIDGTLSAISETRRLVRDERRTPLTLQNEIAQLELAVAELLDPIEQEADHLRQTIFEPDALPLWALRMPEEPLAQHLRAAVMQRWAALREWTSRERPQLLAQAGIIAAALGLLIALRRGGAAREAEPTSPTVLIFARPFSAAIVVGLCATLWLHPAMPVAARSLFGLLAIPILWRLLPGLIGMGFRPVLMGLAALLVLGQLRALAEAIPLIERALFALQMLGALAFATWALRTLRAGLTRVRPAWRRPIEQLLRLAQVLLAISIAADALGYHDLASLLTGGVLMPAYLAVVLFAAVRIADEIAAGLLQAAAARSLRMARTHGDLLIRRGRTVTRSAAVAVWIGSALAVFGLLGPLVGAVGSAFSARLEVGALELSLGDLVAFGVTLGAAFAISAFLRFLLEEDVYPRLRLERGVPNAISSFLHYALLLFGFALALGAAGLELGRVTLLAGAFGVGIGFGLQNVVNNFVSGLILLFERPVNVGDTIQVGALSGEVTRIGVRSSTVRTWEGAEVIVPNASLISDQVINWTLSDRRRRIDLRVGVAYGSDPEQVIALLQEVAHKQEDVLAYPVPVALFKGFGESSLDFELRIWIDRIELLASAQSALAVAVHAALREAGISIPFPHRDITVHMAPPS